MIRSEIHNITFEQAVLASLMTVDQSFSSVDSLLTENDFYSTRHKAIFQAVVSLDAQNQKYDAVMVSEWLSSHSLLDQAGGEKYLMQILAESPPSLFNLPSYAEKLKDYTTCRQVEECALQAIRQAKNLTVSRGELVSSVQSAFAEINTEQASEKMIHIHDAAQATYKEMHEKMLAVAEGRSSVTGIETGITDLDQKLGDIKKGNLMVIGARPGMGKTTMLQVIANHVSIVQGKPVLIMSGEMTMDEIALRMCCAIAPVDNTKVRNAPHTLSSEELTAYADAVAMLEKAPIHINDTGQPSIPNIRESMRKMKHKYGSLGVVIVDFLQIMSTSKNFSNDASKIGYFTKNLKAMAKDFDCPVVVLSQLNRSLENRPNKRPIMSDLRESGTIEQDADQIIFLYRDAEYNKDTQFPHVAEAIIGKNRHGAKGTTYMYAQLQYCQFSNLDPQALDEILEMERTA